MYGKHGPHGLRPLLAMAARLSRIQTLCLMASHCTARVTAQDGEYDASGGGYGFAPIRDDKDFDEIDDGFEVETTIVLRENKTFFVTFIACDNAGNCSFYDPGWERRRGRAGTDYG